MPLQAEVDPRPFTAEYKVYYADWHLGKGTYSLLKTADNSYRFDFSSELKILIFTDYREVSSEFVLRKSRLYPQEYHHDRKGTGPNYHDKVIFNDSKRKISSTVRDHTVIIPYSDHLLDGLSVQLQLMFDVQQNKQHYIYDVLESNAIEHLDFKVLGKPVITIDGKTYECIMFEAIRREGRLKTHIWFAKKMNYLPVQMAHFIDGKKRFNAKLVNYSEM